MNDYRRLWTLDPAVTYLNHGSFGACPRPVLEAQSRFRERLERQPVRFLLRELPDLMDAARAALAAFLGARPEDLVFVPNATSGVNTVLRSLALGPGDELLVSDHEYNACRNALDFVAARTGARVVQVTLPFPLRSPEVVVEAVLGGVTARTRLALLDHVTSQTGLVLPVAALVPELRARGVETLIDGAHAPGMVPLDLDGLGATYYTGNCHKWLCAPKAVAFLHVSPDRQPRVWPLTVSHGANLPDPHRSRFQLLFDWTGTQDPTPLLCVPEALRVLGSLLPGGWSELRARNRALALRGRDILCAALAVPAPAPPEMIGSLAALPLPPGSSVPPPPLFLDPLQDALLHKHGIEVPIIPWPAAPRRLVRISAQMYNSVHDYERLAGALVGLLEAERAGRGPTPPAAGPRAAGRASP